MLLCLVWSRLRFHVSSLVSYLLYRNINIPVLLLLHGNRETRVPACEHRLCRPANDTYKYKYSIVGARCTLKTTVCTVTAASIAGPVTSSLITKGPSGDLLCYRDDR